MARCLLRLQDRKENNIKMGILYSGMRLGGKSQERPPRDNVKT